MKYLAFLIFFYGFSITIQSQNQIKDFNRFISGDREVFLSEGLQMANGLKLRMEYPKGWSSRTGKRPTVLQFFKSPELFEMASISLLQISKLYSGTKEELAFYADDITSELLSDSLMVLSLKFNEHVIIEEYEFLETIISNLDAVCSKCKLTFPGNANIGKIRMYSQMYKLVYKDYYIIIQYMIQQHSYESEIQFNKKINDYIPLLKLMANSIIILNQYDY